MIDPKIKREGDALKRIAMLLLGLEECIVQGESAIRNAKIITKSIRIEIDNLVKVNGREKETT